MKIDRAGPPNTPASPAEATGGRLPEHLPCLSGAQLKWIAMGAMLVDHIAALCIAFWLRAAGLPEDGGWPLYYLVLRAVGRLAFPLYFFLLAEGFRYTHDRGRYLLRLLLFGLISEIPYDLANHDWLFDWQGQNIIFTFAIGLATLSLLERWSGRPALRALALAGGCLLAVALRAEYDMVGILLMAVFFLLRENPVRRSLSAGVLLVYETCYLWCAGLAALVPIGLYSGQRGKIRHPLFFYWFYPAHIFLLYLFRHWVLRI